ncbi:hypothetical protein [Sphingobium sp. YR768]|uniref:hypothetical protein n=1 Tax=Sphingobium sp. YR768 TaxID=1884365 RepID=UPI0008BBA39E|nr:hypothetical protein [Sphingobium sp. YR768]SEQ47792.1 hypothetical protein SAMN05518866_10161 [Sphingobium sp. YR768]
MRKIPAKAYYERRARAEIRKANMTNDAASKRVHLALAASYWNHLKKLEEAKEPEVA